MTAIGHDTLKTLKTLEVDGKSYKYFSLAEAADALGDISKLPKTLKILLENTLRFENGASYTVEDAKSVIGWLEKASSTKEVPFKPARILMQDFTGVPGGRRSGGDARRHPASLERQIRKSVNPPGPCRSGHRTIQRDGRFRRHPPTRCRRTWRWNSNRNGERYTPFYAGARKPFKISASCRQGPASATRSTWNIWLPGRLDLPNCLAARRYAYPDTLYGTDSHTTMVNGMGVLGWGVGGIEAEAAMLGQPIAMLIPDVDGLQTDRQAMPEGATATDSSS